MAEIAAKMIFQRFTKEWNNLIDDDKIYFILYNTIHFIKAKLIEMYSASAKNKYSTPHNANNKSNKIQHACYSCSKLKQEVKTLKTIQQKLAKQIYQIVSFVPKQIEMIMSKIRKSFAVPFSGMVSSKPNLSPLNMKANVRKYSNESQPVYECRLKAQDSVIKQSIKNELNMIRALQSKQKDLRMANEKHETLRKSLSKQSMPSHLKKTSSKPSSARNIESVNSKLQNGFFKSQIQTEQNEWISSPKFGKANQITFQPSWRYSSQDSKPKSHKINNDLILTPYKQRTLGTKEEKEAQTRSQKTQYQVLKCGNGHECYRGDTLNHIPHGGGTLQNCCSKMPFKVNPKTLKYTGCFSFGLFDGKGVLICKDNVKFEGHFVKGLRQGQGMIYLQGSGERGVWDQDKLVSFI